jgi:hypothetical protein
VIEQLRNIIKMCLIHLKTSEICNLDESIFSAAPPTVDNSLNALGLGRVFVHFIKQVTINQLRTLEEVISMGLYPTVRERIKYEIEGLETQYDTLWHRMFKQLMAFQDEASLV